MRAQSEVNLLRWAQSPEMMVSLVLIAILTRRCLASRLDLNEHLVGKLLSHEYSKLRGPLLLAI
jgi:hypothetical protein